MAMLKQIQKTILEILEKELITILALLIVATGIFFVRAQSNIAVYLTVYPPGGSITVTSPDGGETWVIDTTPTITWTTLGPIDDVKIELQRTVGGDWETLIDSTPNDGGYPWLVTSPDTTTATVRITKVDVPSVTDSSNAVFTISAAPEGPSSPGGYVPTYPMIDSISPMSFYYKDATELIIRGLGFEDQVWARLNQITFPLQKPHTHNLITLNLLSNTLAVGTYRLCVYNSSWEFDCYRNLITVTDGTKVIPPTTGGAGEEYAAELIRQFSIRPANGIPLQTEQKLTGQSPDLILKPRETATLWADFKNIGTATWYQDGPNPVRLGTDNKHDRRSGFYHSSWIKYNRPVLVNRVVKPGEIGRFEFTIQAPWIAKTYTEYFRPVAEYKTWMNGNSQVKWTITVQKQSFWQKLFPKPAAQPATPSLSKPAIPSTGGITQPQEPKTPSPYQQTKKPQFGLINFLNNLLQRIKLFFKS